MLEHVTREITVEALPAEIPEVLHADVSEMVIGDTIQLSALTPPSGVKFIVDDPEETTIATLSLPGSRRSPSPSSRKRPSSSARRARRCPKARRRRRARRPPRARRRPRANRAARSRRVGLFDRWRRRRSSPGQTDQGVFPIFPVAGQDQREEREHERGGDERSDDPASRTRPAVTVAETGGAAGETAAAAGGSRRCPCSGAGGGARTTAVSLSSGSATPTPSTRGRATTSGSRSLTSSPAGGSFPRARSRYRGLISEGRAGAGGPRVAVLRPQTYMNESGTSAGPARGALRVPLDHVVVLHDEIDLPFGEVRSRLGGRARGAQRAQEPRSASRRARLLARADRRRPPRQHRSGARLAARPRPLPGGPRRGARAGRAGGERGRACRPRERGGAG